MWSYIKVAFGGYEMRRTTILIADGTRRLRVTVEADPEPIDTHGETVLPAPPPLPRECRETARPPAKALPRIERGRRVA